MKHGAGGRFSGRLVLLTFLCASTAQAANAPPAKPAASDTRPIADAEKPLLWAADAEGGAPYISMDPEHPGQYIGFEVDLIKALEKEIGRPIQFTQFNFTNLASALNRGDIDFAMNGMERTPDREEKFRLSWPYYVFTLQLVVRKDETRINSLDDCRKARNSRRHARRHGRLATADAGKDPLSQSTTARRRPTRTWSRTSLTRCFWTCRSRCNTPSAIPSSTTS